VLSLQVTRVKEQERYIAVKVSYYEGVVTQSPAPQINRPTLVLLSLNVHKSACAYTQAVGAFRSNLVINQTHPDAEGVGH